MTYAVSLQGKQGSCSNQPGVGQESGIHRPGVSGSQPAQLEVRSDAEDSQIILVPKQVLVLRTRTLCTGCRAPGREPGFPSAREFSGGWVTLQRAEGAKRSGRGCNCQQQNDSASVPKSQGLIRRQNRTLMPCNMQQAALCSQRRWLSPPPGRLALGGQPLPRGVPPLRTHGPGSSPCLRLSASGIRTGSDVAVRERRYICMLGRSRGMCSQWARLGCRCAARSSSRSGELPSAAPGGRGLPCRRGEMFAL